MRDDEGVSPVIAAVLVFAMFSTAFFLWSVNTLPEWISEREHAHQQEIQKAFSDLQSEAEALSVSDSPGPAGLTFSLGAQPVAWLQRVPSSGSLSVVSDVDWDAQFGTTTSLYLSANEPTGEPDALVAGNVLGPVSDLMSLVVVHRWTGTGETLTVEASDVSIGGQTTLTSVMQYNAVSTDCTGSELRVTTTLNVGGTPSTPGDRVLSCNLASPSSWEHDLLGDGSKFKSNLGRLIPGYTLTLSHTSLSTPTASAIWLDAAGNEQFLGSGQGADDATLALNTGALQFDPTNLQFVDQVVTWELGAVAANQAEGQSITRRPSLEFDIDTVSNTGYLRWSLVDVQGSGSVSGSTSATATIRHTGTESFLYQTTAPATTFAVTSDHADAWASLFGGLFSLEGTTTAATAVSDGNTMTLTLNADAALTASPVDNWVVSLRIVHIDATIR